MEMEVVMDIDSLEKEIKELDEKIKPLIELKSKRVSQLDKEKSKMFIKLNKITKDCVQHCDDEGVPYFGHIKDFGHWLSTNTSKPWCSWNGCLYQTQEIIAGRMEYNPLGRYEDLQQETANNGE